MKRREWLRVIGGLIVGSRLRPVVRDSVPELLPHGEFILNETLQAAVPIRIQWKFDDQLSPVLRAIVENQITPLQKRLKAVI